MTDEDRERRLASAEAEIAAFCRLFGMKARWEKLSAYRHCEGAWSLVLFREAKKAGRDDVVFAMEPCRTGGDSFWTPKWRTAEKVLTALRRGPKLKWTDVTVSPADGGSVTVTTQREYRVPKFRSVSELKLHLAAAGSEFSAAI